MKSIVISGTDTSVGKTLLSAILMSALPDYLYWKPIQAGRADVTDSETVQRLSGCLPERILPEAYTLSQPLSPHRAAEIDGIEIRYSKLRLPENSPLIIEGAGGLLVPITEYLLFADIFKSWELPVLLACRSGLGTINHTLLSIEALNCRQMPLLGCVLIGEINPSNEQAIEHFGNTPVLGRIPKLSAFTPDILQGVFRDQLRDLRSIL
jgi:dethiobiotin synthetase